MPGISYPLHIHTSYPHQKLNTTLNRSWICFSETHRNQNRDGSGHWKLVSPNGSFSPFTRCVVRWVETIHLETISQVDQVALTRKLDGCSWTSFPLWGSTSASETPLMRREVSNCLFSVYFRLLHFLPFRSSQQTSAGEEDEETQTSMHPQCLPRCSQCSGVLGVTGKALCLTSLPTDFCIWRRIAGVIEEYRPPCIYCKRRHTALTSLRSWRQVATRLLLYVRV